MNRGLRHWWPALPALLILYLGGSSFVDKYPAAARHSVEANRGVRGPDSLLAFIQAGLAADSLARLTARPFMAVATASAKAQNPFRPAHAPNYSAAKIPSGPKVEPPFRKFVLKGTVGNEVATIADRSGRKLIVKVGDGVDSAVVLSIEPNKVTLKDRAGKFELLQEK